MDVFSPRRLSRLVVLVLALAVPCLKVEAWFWQSAGVKSQLELRAFYFAYFCLLLRDWYGCYLFNMSRKSIRSVSKPLGYQVSVFRRPRWCPLSLFRFLVSEDVQWASFVLALIATFILALLGHSQVLRLTVALATTIVEIRFHAALGWHRCILSVWTLWTYMLPAQVSKAARVLALAHSYAGSGLSRLRLATPKISSLGHDLRLVLIAGQHRSLFPRTISHFLKYTPDIVLFFFGLTARIGFEVFAVGLMLFEPSYRFYFNCAAMIFHQSIALATSIDFFDNKVLLCIALLESRQPDTSAHSLYKDCGLLPWPTLWAARLYTMCLFWPVLTLAEDFPFTPNALFPFSTTQMNDITYLARTRYRILAYLNVSQLSDSAILTEDRFCRGHPELVTVDLAATYLQCSETQPAQLYHRVVYRAVKLLNVLPEEAASILVRWLREDKPLLIPNPTTGRLCEPEGIAILRYHDDESTTTVSFPKVGSRQQEADEEKTAGPASSCQLVVRLPCRASSSSSSSL